MDGSAFWAGFVREMAQKIMSKFCGKRASPLTVENTGEFLLLATLRPQNGTSLLSPGAAKCVERRTSSWHQEPSSGGMLKDHVRWWAVVVAKLVGLLQKSLKVQCLGSKEDCDLG